MKLHELALARYASDIAAFCPRWQIRELAVFGSLVRGELRPDSDIDLLVRFAPTVEWDLLDMQTMQDELGAIFGRTVDLVEREAIEQTENWIVRREVLGSAETLYAST